MENQRRNHFRVFVTLPVTAWTVDEDGATHDAFSAETQDLSAGGALLQSDRQLEQGQAILLDLVCDEPPLDIEVNARVLRVWDENGLVLSAVRFERLAESAQSALVRYTNAVERLTIERRLAARMTVELPVMVATADRNLVGYTVDISADSALISSSDAVALGDDVQITFAGDARTNVAARVTHVAGGEFAVSYPGASRQAQAAIVRAALAEERRIARRPTS